MFSISRISLAIFVLCLSSVAQAQAGGRGDIVLQGLIQPEVETMSLVASCFSRTFSFTLTNHRLRPSVLTDARLDGRRPRSPESVASLRQFLAGARLVHFTGATCVSRDEISIGLSGLLISPPSGQHDDFLRVFRIHF